MITHIDTRTNLKKKTEILLQWAVKAPKINKKSRTTTVHLNTKNNIKQDTGFVVNGCFMRFYESLW